ncbi:ABC transporter substrate-binding protein [Hoeflea poritis]|uniref:ABC transporter substrate-binding protein n=1 Tax=Hoeflea poritis TaxID=2993659 RepID=A0ABT4VT36_9HYPH|nr:ABC transporter substrate-binding protein [Hoeflea poritis]MDA4847350.1 ABC transporter substrate-binding protein [Hoeflea poritis]
MRIAALTGLFVAAGLLIAATSSAMQGPIRFGAVYNLSGDWGAYGIPSSRGAKLHVEQVNGKGGVLSRPIELIVKDAGGTPEGAAAAATEILAEAPDVPALFGLSGSDQARTAGEVSAQSKRVFLTSGATSPQLPFQVPGFLFLACFGDNVQAAAAAQYAYETLGARSATILYDASHTYTRLLQDYFSSSFKAHGGQIVSAVKFQGADKFASAITRASAADIIFVAAETPADAFAFARAVRENGFDQPIFGGDGYDGDSVWSADPALKDIYFTTHAYFADDNPSPRAQAFAKAYATAHDGAVPDSFAGLGYDAAGLLVAAIEKAGSSEPDKLLDALATIENYRGVTGTISYVDGSHVPRKSVTILKIADGRRNFIAAFTPTEIPAP